ncbi:MAG: hypothetical protein IPK16_33275 [Anaerolineales bacterium]|nr:hypothetical protein [Anaerolineales bacterium]
MAVYQSSEQFYQVMNDVFSYVIEHPQHIESFTRSNLVIRMRTTDPDAEIFAGWPAAAAGSLLRPDARAR